MDTKTVESIAKNQSRLRENIKKLKEHTSTLYLVRKYLKDMTRDENDILTARHKIATFYCTT